MMQNMKAWVVFSGKADLPWLRILKPGFRHCYVLLHDGKNWVSVDPLSHLTDVNVHDIPLGIDLPNLLSHQGLTVVNAEICPVKKQAPIMIFTCVEAVKRVLGIHNMFILTPWQLYKFLQRQCVEDGRAEGAKKRNTTTIGDPVWEA